MKKQLLSFVALLCVVWLTSARALAYDFEVDGIYYNITSSSNPLTVEVTNNGYSNYGTYAGATTIPETVTYNEVTYTVTSIGQFAFQYCSVLTSVEIPASVTRIGYRAFRDCSGLTSIEIPASVTSIGYQAFSGCTGLTSIEIPASVTSIGEGAFGGCTGLTSIEIPASVTSIGDAAFSGCSHLTSIEIPNSVTSIGSRAFYNCLRLTEIEIPSSVTSIGGEAFYDCIGLKKVISHATVPPTCGTNVWSYVNKSTCTLYVPTGSKAAYAAAEGWKDFRVIKEFDTTEITTLDAEATDTDLSDCEIYTAGGQRVDALQAGMNIVRIKNGTVKKIVKR